jgi:CspA family cold shock protein
MILLLRFYTSKITFCRNFVGTALQEIANKCNNNFLKLNKKGKTMSNRYNGTVKWFNEEKGFGFIQREDEGKDLFVHHTDIQSEGYHRVSLEDGQKVSFEIGSTEKGDCAKSVEVL